MQHTSASPRANQSHAQLERLSFIELRLRFLGEVGRQHLTEEFGIKTAAASRDLAVYRGLVPRNLRYQARSKSYERTDTFRPSFDVSAASALGWLCQGWCRGVVSSPGPQVAAEGTSLSGRIDLELISVLTRAIHKGAAVSVVYRSLTSGLTTRQIVPFALADGGLRWHVRAFDRRTGEFRDFVIGRIEDACLLLDDTADHEMSHRDVQWNRIAELELVPHPANVHHPDTVEAEYGMSDGTLRVQVRAAMAGYMLRRWNVDCTEDHSLRGGEYHLWLRNRQALYGVTNLVLAPGYGAIDLED